MINAVHTKGDELFRSKLFALEGDGQIKQRTEVRYVMKAKNKLSTTNRVDSLTDFNDTNDLF